MTGHRLAVLAAAAGLLLTACAGGPAVPEAVAGRAAPGAARLPTAAGQPDPAGEVRVAYATVPDRWVAPAGDDPAATDLAALWGLPLYRLDDDGQLRPGLVARATAGTHEGGLEVVLRLRAGEWSDDRPVRAADVVATLRSLRSGPLAEQLSVLTAVTAVGERRVRLRFDRPYARWPYLLADTGGVLPAHVLRDGGLDAYADGIPVSGGWFRLVDHDPGRSATFAAHGDGPLGPPRVGRVTVLFTPAYGTALGLLEDGRVDAVLGHLALNPVGRAREISGVEAAAPIGGTWVGLRWRPDGPLGSPDQAPARRAVNALADPAPLVDGLLGAAGAPPAPPAPVADASAPGDPDEGDLPSRATLLVPGWHEAAGFTARALQADADTAGMRLELVVRGTPELTRAARTSRGGALTVHRDAPRPSYLPHLPAGARELGLSADASAAHPDEDAAAAVTRAGLSRPLYRIGVAHAWRAGALELSPSSWPGLGLWNAGTWRLDDPAGARATPLPEPSAEG